MRNEPCRTEKIFRTRNAGHRSYHREAGYEMKDTENTTNMENANNIGTSVIQQTDFKNLKITLGGYGSFSFHSVDSNLHRHSDFYEIILIISGTYKHTYQDRTEDVNRGTLMLLSPYSTHRLYTEPMQAIHFVTCIEQNYFREFAARCFPTELQTETIPECFITRLDPKETDYLELLAHRLCAAKPSLPAANTILYLTLMNIANTKARRISTHPNYVDELISVLNNPVNLSISANELCKDFEESTSTILRNFKKYTGYTIVAYKSRKRLELATDMLINSDIKITDISYNLQYDSLSYFLRVFKKEYGITPSQYREKYRKKSME